MRCSGVCVCARARTDVVACRYVKQTMCFLSKVLGDAFIPYMPRVFPPLIKAAAAEVRGSARLRGCTRHGGCVVCVVAHIVVCLCVAS